MKSAPLFALLLALATPACVTEYSDYGTSYSESYTGYGPAPVYRGYETPYYGSVRPAYYGGSYGSYSGYDRYRYDRDDCDDNRSYRRDDDRKKSDSSSRDIRITDYNQSRKRGSLPEGYHPPEWWKARGYSLEQNTYKNRDGEERGRGASDKKKKKN